MKLYAAALPEGFPAVIEEYEWFLKCMDTPEGIIAIRGAAVLAILFVGITYFYYSRKSKRKKEEES